MTDISLLLQEGAKEHPGRTLDPNDLAHIIEVLAPAFSQGRRKMARLVTGEGRAFFTSKSCSHVYVPFPLPAGDVGEDMSKLRIASCGLVLQASPSKEALAELRLNDLHPRELEALILVEGEVAMAWAIDQWPGLACDLRKLLPTLKPTNAIGGEQIISDGNFVSNGKLLIEAALKIVRLEGKNKLYVPDVLGVLPSDERARRSMNSYFRALGRMPYNLRKNQPNKTFFAIPVGGSGGVRSTNIPPPSRPEEDDPETRSNRRIGIPYDEWNMLTRRYQRGHVSVIEKHAAIKTTEQLNPQPEIVRWFKQSPSRTWYKRLEDGTDLDVDAFVDQHCAQAAGNDSDGRLYKALNYGARDVATAILLDGSASLGIDGGLHLRLQLACADALTMALSHAKEPHGVFAFSGNTRHKVEVSVLKDFNEPRAIMPGHTGLKTAGYTRLGAPLRHLTRRLMNVPAERRILLSLGDGLPSDEGYEGRYAWADVLHAVEEAEECGVLIYHIGVGRVKFDPLEDCFGLHRSQRVSSVSDLPRVLAQVHEGLRTA